jgi:NAD(P) transhydrogenase subunit alpha
VPRESEAGERRVALVPAAVAGLGSDGAEVVVESGAGEPARLPDELFSEAGAVVAEDPAQVWGAEVVVKVAPPSTAEIDRLSRGSVLVGFLRPLTDADTVTALRDAGVTGFALESVPRISRAQSMDALSSQASVAGYRAALAGAVELGRFYPTLMTAAGSVKPATVLVLGAGVAGLQALATARRLGANTVGFDVRPEVKDQIQSLGAKWLQLEGLGEASGEGGYARALTDEEQDRQRELLAKAMQVTDADVVITTAQVPGKQAPLLLTEDAVANLKPGSVVVDLAAEAGGNCALTVPGETVTRHHVRISGPLNVASELPEHASALYANNIRSLLGLLISDGALRLDFDDEVLDGACVTHDGEIRNERARELVASRSGAEQKETGA